MMLATLAFLVAAGGPGSLPPLHVHGADLVDPHGKKVVLRGCNLGNWFVVEHWMLDQEQPQGSSQDQYQLEQILQRRFGAAEKNRLMELYRSSWITERDFPIIKSFRFNVVRLPLNYRLFEDDAKPFHLRSDAWKWTDRAITWAKKYGIYVILDMHGAQGGQSVNDHTGRRDQNKLWTSVEDQRRYVWLWGQIAKRYRNESAVVAYDTLNEPYGGTKKQIREIFDKVYPEIRKNDPEKLIWACAKYDGWDMYGDPHANGWHNVGIEDHFYPGIFDGASPTVRTQTLFMDRIRKEVGPEIAALRVPFLSGEFNVLFDSAGGAEMMRRAYDLYESLGWTSTMWAYKALNAEGGFGSANWGMVTNKKPFKRMDFRTAPKKEIEGFFRSQGTMQYAVYDKLRDWLAPKSVTLKPLPQIKLRTEAPDGQYPGWTRTDVGGARKGGLETQDGKFFLYGGGDDVWGSGDHFSFLHRQVRGDFDLYVTLDSMEDLGQYCKAGVMLRSGLGESDKALLLSSFPSGDVQAALRSEAGKDMSGTEAVKAGLPVQMRLSRHSGAITVSYRKTSEEGWHVVQKVDSSVFPDVALCGVMALSHDDSQLIKVGYSDLRLETGAKNQ